MLDRFFIKSINSFSVDLKAIGLFLLFLILFNNVSLSQFNQKEIWFFRTSFLITLFINAPPPRDTTVELIFSIFKCYFFFKFSKIIFTFCLKYF